jgi:hypothetical protein
MKVAGASLDEERAESRQFALVLGPFPIDGSEARSPSYKCRCTSLIGLEEKRMIEDLREGNVGGERLMATGASSLDGGSCGRGSVRVD